MYPNAGTFVLIRPAQTFYERIIFAIWGPGYDALAKSGPIYDAAGIGDLDKLRQDALADISQSGGDFPETARLAANKAFDIAESIVDGFASGIAGRSLTLAGIGLIGLLAAIFWASILAATKRIRSSLPSS